MGKFTSNIESKFEIYHNTRKKKKNKEMKMIIATDIALPKRETTTNGAETILEGRMEENLLELKLHTCRQKGLKPLNQTDRQDNMCNQVETKECSF